jgi:hypothetical protein
VNVPFPLTSGVMSTMTQVPLVVAPVAAIDVLPMVGALFQLTNVSDQDESATGRTTKPPDEPATTQMARRARSTVPACPDTVNFR